MAKVREVLMMSSWVRFTRYEIYNGYIIPAKGAEFERYSLLDGEADSGNGKDRASNPGPHISLANLDFRSESSVLDWVRRWGLLGNLLQDLKQAEFSNGVQFALSNYPTPFTWTAWPSEDDLAAGIDGDIRGVLPGRVIENSRYQGGEMLKVTDAERFFSRYFPKGMPEGGYPAPNADGFWQHYGESVEDLARFATNLRTALNGLSGISNTGDEERDFIFNTPEIARLFILYNATLHPNVPLGVTKGSLLLHAPTLRASLACLVWLDFSGGKKIDTCKTCGHLFVTNLESKEYCSTSCKKVAEMRRYRGRTPGA